MGGGGFGGDYSTSGYTHNSGRAEIKDVALSGRAGAGFGGAVSSEKDACLFLTFPTPLNSVSPTELSITQVGDVLDVALINGVVAVLAKNNNILGSVTAAKLPDLINCLNAKHQYIAIVQSIQGGMCVVVIKHK